MSGFLVRVIRPFDPATDDEINLRVDDVAQVNDSPHRRTRDERYWIRLFFDGGTGLFPRSHVTDLLVSEEDIVSLLSPDSKAFVAKESFLPQEAGDLGFNRGSIVIGTRVIDENWWHGFLYFDATNSTTTSSNSRKTGMFPITHVYPLDLKPRNGPSTLSSSQLRNIRRGIVLVDMEPQLEKEIRLRKGCQVIVYASHDDLFYRGESEGEIGIFPKTFVKLFEDAMMAEGGEEGPPSYETALRSVCPEEDAVPTQGIMSYGMSVFPFQGEYANELSFKAGEIVYLIRHVDHEWMEGEVNGNIGIFPTSYVDIVVDVHADHNEETLQQPSDETEAETREDSLETMENYPEDTYGRVLYDFVAEDERDISVKQGATVTLLRRFGDEWIEAMDDSNACGFIPFSYVEVITDSEIVTSVPEDATPDINTTFMKSPFEASFDVQEPILYESDDAVEAETMEAEVSNEDIGIHLEPPEQPDRPRVSNESAGNFSLRDITISRGVSPQIKTPVRPAPPRPSPSRTAPPRPPNPILSPTKIKDVTSAFDPLAKPPFHDSTASVGAHAVKPANGSVSRSVSVESTTKPSSKRNEQRSCILTELLQSERDYIESLKVSYSLLEKPSQEKEDFKHLIGNLGQIIEAATALFTQLEDTIKNNNGKDVGLCFTSTADQTRQAYSRYCQNSKDIQSIWNKVSAEGAPSDVKAIVAKINDRIRNETNSYDLPSMLIKPIQRILKYPLLLSELVKTSSNPRETEQLQDALETMTKMASEINEYKRRKELVQKYRRVNLQELTLSEKISRLTIHAVKKKSSRLGMKLYSKIGLVSTTKDPEFDSLFTQFKSLEKTIKIFLKDLLLLMENQHLFLKYSHDFVQSVVDFYAGKRNIDEIMLLLQIHKEIWENIWSDMKKLLKFNVLEVIETLLKKFEGPNHLIAKRNDKCADYDSVSRSRGQHDAVLSNKTRNEEEAKKHDFEALNTQLIDELPPLIRLSTEIFNNSLAAFLKIKKLFIGRTAQSLLNLLNLPLMTSSTASSAAEVQETFNVKFNLLLDDLSRDFTLLSPVLLTATHYAPSASHATFTPTSSKGHTKGSRARNASPMKFPPRPASSSPFAASSSSQQPIPQTTNDREKIFAQFHPQNIYVTSEDYWSIAKMDVSVKKGDIVGVLVRKNPMGSDLQWFVDTGHAKGFLPRKILSPYTAAHVELPKNNSDPSSMSLLDGVDGRDLLRFENNNKNSNGSSLSQFDPLGPLASSSSSSSRDSSTIRASDILAEVMKPTTSATSPSVTLNSDDSETYVAMYPFDASTEGTLSLHAGQFVTVKARADLTGNAEWFLVEDPATGNKGYVPANYIIPFNQVKNS